MIELISLVCPVWPADFNAVISRNLETSSFAFPTGVYVTGATLISAFLYWLHQDVVFYERVPAD